MPSPRQHRSLKSRSNSLPMTVEAVTPSTITLSSAKTGIIKWPTSHFSGILKKGDQISLTLGELPKPLIEKPDLNDLRSLLQELVG